MSENGKQAEIPVSFNGAHPDVAMRSLPDNLAVKCPKCRELLLGKDWERNLKVCPRCGHHAQLTADERIDLLTDEKTFIEIDGELVSNDPLKFVSNAQTYSAKLEGLVASTQLTEGVKAGAAKIDGLPLMLVVMDFRFLGGSMGAVVGEKITHAIEIATRDRVPLLISTASGGARMQEGVIALMQMAKTSAALARMADAGVPFIVLLTDPTTGGVTASFAMLGDVTIAEPGALVAFTGPRVIEQSLHVKLPKDVGYAEFLLAHGMIDSIVHRRDLRPTIARLLHLYAAAEAAVAVQ
ncbi:MAG TPA: acetyl-CoA carboxylase, carboxyltransferase subunit beta [Ktedonobacterales bacterium]|nr:acetyl-CoA carboxylase, carboxyltransferase subunit beta [Ktedonobacterales bacterium]